MQTKQNFRLISAQLVRRNYHTMFAQSKFYIIVILYQKLIGIAPFGYNRSTKKFFTNKFHLIYPTAIMVAYSFFYCTLAYKTVLNGEFEPNLNQKVCCILLNFWRTRIVCCLLTASTSFLVWMTCVRYITTISSWIAQCANRVAIVKFFNDAFHLHGQFIKRYNENVKVLRTLVQAGIVTIVNVLLNLFAISGTVLLVDASNFNENMEDAPLLLPYVLIIASFIIKSALSTTFFGLTLIAKLYFLMLNNSE